MALHRERVSMRDGVRLAVDVYRPDAEPPFPALLILTPYGRGNLQGFAHLFGPRGYALVVGDVRGRYDSEGEYRPISQERTDVPDVIDWIAEQSWYDPGAGIGVVGISYLAAIGLIGAAERPQHVRALLNIGGFSDTYALTHRGGALVLHHLLPWSIITSFSPQPSLDGIDWAAVYSTLPLREAAVRAGYDNELWWHCADHPCNDATWAPMDLDDLLARVDVPTLHITGWYDLCQGTTLALYERFAGRCESPQRLIVGPWSHNGVLRGPTELCGVDFGAHSRLDMPKEIGDFFDAYLNRTKGGEAGGQQEEQPRVRLFLTGENRWLQVDQWPPVGAEPLELFLSEEGLSIRAPVVAGVASYSYDPRRPTPTLGGAVWEFPVAGLEPGPADQTPLRYRGDLRVFASAPLTEPITLVGPVSCVLHAETDGETTDFVAKLLDIEPDGTARLICDGIVRAHLRADPSEVRPVQPGAVVQYEVDMWSAGHTFRPGHRIGLEVTSASFPKWDRNPNSLDGVLRTAQQRIHWGGNYASRLRLWVG